MTVTLTITEGTQIKTLSRLDSPIGLTEIKKQARPSVGETRIRHIPPSAGGRHNLTESQRETERRFSRMRVPWDPGRGPLLHVAPREGLVCGHGAGVRAGCGPSREHHSACGPRKRVLASRSVTPPLHRRAVCGGLGGKG